jgi:hypothetical protein
MYLCKFDETGRRTSTVAEGIHFKADAEKQAYLDDGYIETSDEDYQYYVGNMGAGANGTGYVRDAETGKPVDAPAYVPSKEEQLADLDAQFRLDQATIMEYFTQAVFDGDTDAQEELKEEMEEIKTTYAEERKALEEG